MLTFLIQSLPRIEVENVAKNTRGKLFIEIKCTQEKIPEPIAQLVAGVTSLIPARYHTFLEMEHEIISMIILPLPLIKKGCCQLQAKVCAQSTD